MYSRESMRIAKMSHFVHIKLRYLLIKFHYELYVRKEGDQLWRDAIANTYEWFDALNLNNLYTNL